MPTITVKLVDGNEIIIITGKQYIYSAKLHKFDGYWDSYREIHKDELRRKWACDSYRRTFENYISSYLSEGADVAFVAQEAGTTSEQLKRLQKAATRG